MVAARHLRDLTWKSTAVCGGSGEADTDAAIQRDIVARMGIAASVYRTGSISGRDMRGVVDALLGTGTAGAPREPYASLIRGSERQRTADSRHRYSERLGCGYGGSE